MFSGRKCGDGPIALDEEEQGIQDELDAAFVGCGERGCVAGIGEDYGDLDEEIVNLEELDGLTEDELVEAALPIRNMLEIGRAHV